MNITRKQSKRMQKNHKKVKWKNSDWTLFFMALLGFVFIGIFCYGPMFGIILAFKDGNNKLNVVKAMFETDWVGLKNFIDFFLDQKFSDVILNTIGLNLIRLVVCFPAPIIFALLLNEVKHKRIKSVIQSASIFPHFLSWVVFGGIIIALCDMTTGVMNPILYFFRIGSRDDPINLLTGDYFWQLIIISELLKGVGWGSVIYLASISSINPQIYEAAKIDGASRFQQIFRITLPLITPTITIYLLLQVSNLLSNSFEQFYMLQNASNISRSEVLSTYIYSTGIIQRKYSYTTALGVFESISGLILLLVSNKIAKKVSGRGLFN